MQYWQSILDQHKRDITKVACLGVTQAKEKLKVDLGVSQRCLEEERHKSLALEKEEEVLKQNLLDKKQRNFDLDAEV